MALDDLIFYESKVAATTKARYQSWLSMVDSKESDPLSHAISEEWRASVRFLAVVCAGEPVVLGQKFNGTTFQDIIDLGVAIASGATLSVPGPLLYSFVESLGKYEQVLPATCLTVGPRDWAMFERLIEAHIQVMKLPTFWIGLVPLPFFA